MTKLLVSLAILLGAAAAAATPAGADPNPFGTLGCSCHSRGETPTGKPDLRNPIDQGIQNGLGSLHRTRGS
ncbi:hypothetical protein GCM10009641_05480 [Mycobacterium cookii]|uniref:Uncharacterized protein n=1 Tax=Mycobacterium cookii TaxID=1775 RepID=A0A7I7L381_9MYCO|nr:hypothetical protein [Mycobacterium cookii]MCV7328928.1 hypothetical protein [Mycobacterium cookii]BBX48406.1 hypothetical protein MCOO_44210 [Mycobacterium cookii]